MKAGCFQLVESGLDLERAKWVEGELEIGSHLLSFPRSAGCCLLLSILWYCSQSTMRHSQGRIQDFFRRGCTRLLLYFNTNKPHSFFFGRIPVVLENHRSSQVGVRTPCTLPLDSPLIAHVLLFWFSISWKVS